MREGWDRLQGVDEQEGASAQGARVVIVYAVSIIDKRRPSRRNFAVRLGVSSHFLASSTPSHQAVNIPVQCTTKGLLVIKGGVMSFV